MLRSEKIYLQNISVNKCRKLTSDFYVYLSVMNKVSKFWDNFPGTVTHSHLRQMHHYEACFSYKFSSSTVDFTSFHGIGTRSLLAHYSHF